jgi:hypothetical protein
MLQDGFKDKGIKGKQVIDIAQIVADLIEG